MGADAKAAFACQGCDSVAASQCILPFFDIPTDSSFLQLLIPLAMCQHKCEAKLEYQAFKRAAFLKEAILIQQKSKKKSGIVPKVDEEKSGIVSKV